MKKKLFFVVLSALTVVCSAQSDDGMRNRWKLSYGLLSNVPSGTILSMHPGIGQSPIAVGNAELEWSHRVTPSLSMGLYTGGRMGSRLLDDTTILATTGDTPAPVFGFNARVDILSLAGADSKHWAPYVSGKAGVWIYEAVRKEYGIGAGVDYFPTKHVGCFAEFQVGHYPAAEWGHLLKSESQFKVGLVLRY